MADEEQPQSAPPKKSQTWMVIVIGVLGFLCMLVVVIGAAMVGDRSGPGSGSGRASLPPGVSATAPQVPKNGHVFPLERTTGFSNTWLADRCGGTGSGRPHAHGGIDIMHHKNDKVPDYAVVDGKIFKASGSSIWLASLNPDDQYTYYYTHLSSVLVSRGDTVKVGQLIAFSAGYSGGAQGDHTHFGMMTCPNSPVEVPFSGGKTCSTVSMAEREQIAASTTCLVNPYPTLVGWR